MSNEPSPRTGTPLLAVLAYLNLSTAESWFTTGGRTEELAERVPIGRLAGESLTRYARLCDAIPGGQAGALTAMQRAASPVDEFNAMTKPRSELENHLRALFTASLELELVARLPDGLGEVASEAVAASAVMWRTIDHASSRVLSALADQPERLDGLSNYARRMLGEGAVMGQRLLVRDVELRRLFTGGDDDDLTASGRLLDEVLGAIATRLGQLGLAV